MIDTVSDISKFWATRARRPGLGPRARMRARWQLARFLLRVRPDPRARRFSAAIVKPDRLGDFVLATGAIRRLTDYFGEDQCVLFISSYAEALACREFPNTPRVIVPAFVPKKLRALTKVWLNQRRTLGARSFSHAVCLRHFPSLYRDTLLSWLPAERWHGLPAPIALNDFPGGEFPFEEAVPQSEFLNDAPNYDLGGHQRVVSSVLGLPVAIEEILPRLRSVPVEPRGPLVICPFSSQAFRDYPIAQLIEALSLVRARVPVPMQFLVASATDSRLGELQRLAQAAGLVIEILNTAESFDRFLGAIGAARAVLTMETASAHLAAAMDQRTLVLLGGGHIGLLAPWSLSPRQRWLEHRLPCAGCDWKCVHSETRCITEISPSTIATNLIELLRMA